VAKKPDRAAARNLTTNADDLLAAALAGGSDTLETGRFIATFRKEAVDAGIRSLTAQGMRVADTRDFGDQAVAFDDLGDAEALVFPRIGAAVVTRGAAEERGLTVQSDLADGGPVQTIEPEYFVFSERSMSDLLTASDPTVDERNAEYLRGFAQAAEVIARELCNGRARAGDPSIRVDALAVGATWGLVACRVPPSLRSGAGIKVAVLDTGMDLGHPEFTGRQIVSQSFVGQPVQDLHSHGTHCIGTACGPQLPPGPIDRYGIAFASTVFAGKVLTNSGSGSTAAVLAGIEWAIANRCEVISMSLGSQSPVQTAYTAAGQAALDNGLLIVAAAGNFAQPTGSPANSPTIMSVASLDENLTPSSFSDFGKIDIAAPGRDVFSSVPRPTVHGTKSGTSMATPHVAGCAALWAQTSPTLRGTALWKQLQSSARTLPLPATRVGAGLVQAP
jgi:subtilisin